MTDPSYRKPPPLTPDEKQALIERERARLNEPGYRERLVGWSDLPEESRPDRKTPEAPPAERVDARSVERVLSAWGLDSRPERQAWRSVAADAAEAFLPEIRAAERAARPLPDWMPTPEELDDLERLWWTKPDADKVRLLRAVRWLLDERGRTSEHGRPGPPSPAPDAQS